MVSTGSRLPVPRLIVAVILGIVAGAVLARLSDSLWWQVLPWALLAAFWVFILGRRRGPKLPSR